MATTAPPSNSSSISNRLFESLAAKNYHELIQLYGQVAIQSLEGYQDNLEQWQATAYRHGHSRSERGKQSCCIQMDLCLRQLSFLSRMQEWTFLDYRGDT
jgi:hypothetical protein